MVLRCLLFTSDEGTAGSVRQALSDLSVQAEHCRVAVEAVQKVTKNPFNLLIVDWDSPTEAAFLLKTARERKASERPLTVAIVSRDLNVSQALQAGANSIVRKPIVVAQLRDSLASACDLVRSRKEASTQAGVSMLSPGAALPTDSGFSTKTLRAGEFLQSTTAPGTQFVTEADVNEKIQKTIDQAAVEEMNPLKDLEPVAAAVEKEELAHEAATPAPEATPASGETRGLAWYLKARAAAQAPIPPPATSPKPELISYEQTATFGDAQKEPSWLRSGDAASKAAPSDAADPAVGRRTDSEKKTESALFAYMSGESPHENDAPVQSSTLRVRRLILSGALIAICMIAYLTVPQESWHHRLQILLSHAVYYAHNWLNPQATTPTQVPAAHENFGLAGDEYKLPVAQNIPDATTDPTQIRVIPVVDPTAKKTNGATSTVVQAGADGNATENSAQNTGDETQTYVQVKETAQPGSASANSGPLTTSSPPPTLPAGIAVPPVPAEPGPASVNPPRRDPMLPVSPVNSRPKVVGSSAAVKPSAGIPSSLKSQMASMTPDASGNKPVEASLPSIEPVNLAEATARSLLLQESELEYPASARGQQGSVALQVLIARDGSVQDAKFLQGSFAFARAATDAVKQWRFRPYTLNGRPVAIQTVLTLSFKPTS